MTNNHLPDAQIDPNLLEYLGATAEVDYSRRFLTRYRLERLDTIDDRDLLFTTMPTYKYGSKIVLNDDGVYFLNRLYAYYRDHCGVAHLNDWHHVYAMIDTHPMLRELWDQFEAAMVLCGSRELLEKGRL